MKEGNHKNEHDISAPHRDKHYLLLIGLKGRYKMMLDFQAYLNNTLIKILPKPYSRFMLATFEHPSSQEKISGLNERIGKSVKSLLDQFAIVRNYGPHGLQLASIAAGRIDIFVRKD